MQKNDFENNVFKLMNNAIFGKTMVNVKKTYIYIKVVTKKQEGIVWYQNQKIIKQNSFQKCISHRNEKNLKQVLNHGLLLKKK